MRIAVDTETTGSDFQNGCRPFYISTTDEKGRVESWEWDVDPTCREVVVPKKEVREITKYLSGHDLIMHNAPFDIEALESVGVILDLSRIDDTAGMAHCFDSHAPKGLKRAATTYAGIEDTDQKDLKKAIVQARAFGKKQGWEIAQPGHRHFPHLKRMSKETTLENLDMWLPRAAWKFSDEIKEKHPEWETICSIYGDMDTYRTIVMDTFYRFQLNKRGLWDQYVQNQKRLIKRIYEMKMRGTQLIPSQAKKIRARYSAEAQKRIKQYCSLLREEPHKHTDNETRHALHNKFHIPILMWTDGGKGKSLKAQKPSTKAGHDGILPTYKSLLEKAWSNGLLSCGVDLPSGYTLSDYYDTESDIPPEEHAAIKDSIRHISLSEDFEILPEKEFQKVVNECVERGIVHDASSRLIPQGNDIPYRLQRKITRGTIQKAWLYIRHLVGAKKYTKALEYIDSYVKHADSEYRVHFNYTLFLTKTLRWSSKDPNAHNIGNPTAMSEEGNPWEMWGVHTDLRSVFGPRKGRIWICGDYSQLQLRLFAKWSQEQSLVEAFEKGYDAHTNIACRIFDIPLEESKERITKAMRRIGKNVNFGFIFGASPAKIELTAGRPGLWDTVTTMFPNAHRMMERTKRQVKHERRIWTPGGYPLVVGKEHAGVNYIIQGAEGEIVREAVDSTQSYLDELNATHKCFTNAPGFITLQVHDEMVFDLPEETPLEVLQHLKYLMESAGSKFGFTTPIDLGIVRFGKSWSKAEDLEI